jgi:hypothetical protein
MAAPQAGASTRHGLQLRLLQCATGSSMWLYQATNWVLVCVLAWISVPCPSGQEGAVLRASHLGDCVQRRRPQRTSDVLL